MVFCVCADSSCPHIIFHWSLLSNVELVYIFEGHINIQLNLKLFITRINIHALWSCHSVCCRKCLWWFKNSRRNLEAKFEPFRCWGRNTWWRNQMETFSALLALGAGNSPVTGEFPAQRPVTRSFDVLFNLYLINGWVNNREAGDLISYRAHYDVIGMMLVELDQCQGWLLIPWFLESPSHQ